MLLLTGTSVAVFMVLVTISIPLQTPSVQSTNAANSCPSDVQSSDCKQQGFQQEDRNTQDNTFANQVTSIDANIDINLE
jgi:hypothetical protein